MRRGFAGLARLWGAVAFLASYGVVGLAAASAPAEGHGPAHDGIKWIGCATEEDPRVGFLFVLFNFAVLFFILRKILFRPLIKGNREKSDTIRSELERATKARVDAEAVLVKYSSRVETINGEVEVILHKARESAELERKALLADAEREAAKIIEAAKVAAKNESERALVQLEGEVVDRAIARAEAAVRAQFGDQDQERMLTSYVSQVEDIDPAKLASKRGGQS